MKVASDDDCEAAILRLDPSWRCPRSASAPAGSASGELRPRLAVEIHARQFLRRVGRGRVDLLRHARLAQIHSIKAAVLLRPIEDDRRGLRGGHAVDGLAVRRAERSP